MSVPDHYDAFRQHQAKQDKWLESCPVCGICVEPIQDNHYYRINGDKICPTCLMIEFREDVLE